MKLYKEQLQYEEIRKRTEAEFGYAPSNGVIHRYGIGAYKGKRSKTKYIPQAVKPCYCAYCGNKLKGEKI